MMQEPTVDRIMQRTLFTIAPKDTLAAAQALMDRNRFHQLPVIDDGRLIGIVSERDLRSHSGYYERTKVDAAMTSNLVTVTPAMPAQHAARILIDNQINALPVVDGDRLVGIVSRTDLLHLLVTLLEEQSPRC